MRVLQETGMHLFHSLLAPVAAWLDPQRKLIVEPDGAATVAPFEAIPLPGGGTLGDHFAIEFSPGIYYRRAMEPVRLDRAGPALVVGSPALSPELAEAMPPLPEALREARTVEAQFDQAKLLAGADATVPALKRSLPFAALFHFAGHALYTSRQSALLLAPGPGTTDTAGHLDARRLADVSLCRCSLVVLSGCSTGRLSETSLSDPDSLVRAFLAAGAGTVVASRWNVDSSVTERLMEVFYQALRQGHEPASSLRIAEADVRSRPETRHPYYWSAFTCFGSQ
jgi:CHAT domain-containing protein